MRLGLVSLLLIVAGEMLLREYQVRQQTRNGGSSTRPGCVLARAECVGV